MDRQLTSIWMSAMLVAALCAFGQPSSARHSIVGAEGTPFTWLRKIPKRRADASTGREFLLKTTHLSPEDRERAILDEIRAGNVPEFLRHLVPLNLVATGADGVVHRAKVWVTPDYLAIGSNDDFVRIPMGPRTAQIIADEFDFVLPTRKLVDEIYAHADSRLTPLPMTASHEMNSNNYYLWHNVQIERQLPNQARELLVSGHKKDLVITTRLQDVQGRVAIYGWHREPGKAIQPLSLVHNQEYADYSHGVRLIRSVMIVDGAEVPVQQVLQDPALNVLLSDEGTFSAISYL